MVNQRDIVNRIADKTGLYKKDIKEMLLAFKEVMVDVFDEDVFLFLLKVCYSRAGFFSFLSFNFLFSRFFP